jgi:hypothetical protein
LSSLHETAYPPFKPELTQRELEDIYTPNEEELRLARRLGKTIATHLYSLVLLKTLQRLGYFARLADIPLSIISSLTKHIGARPVPPRELFALEKSNTRQHYMDAIHRKCTLRKWLQAPKR